VRGDGGGREGQTERRREGGRECGGLRIREIYPCPAVPIRHTCVETETCVYVTDIHMRVYNGYKTVYIVMRVYITDTKRRHACIPRGSPNLARASGRLHGANRCEFARCLWTKTERFELAQEPAISSLFRLPFRVCSGAAEARKAPGSAKTRGRRRQRLPRQAVAVYAEGARVAAGGT
jgi:hypothetical protein